MRRSKRFLILSNEVLIITFHFIHCGVEAIILDFRSNSLWWVSPLHRLHRIHQILGDETSEVFEEDNRIRDVCFTVMKIDTC